MHLVSMRSSQTKKSSPTRSPLGSESIKGNGVYGPDVLSVSHAHITYQLQYMICSIELKRKPINRKTCRTATTSLTFYKGHPSLAPPMRRRPRPSALHRGGHAALHGGDGYAESDIARGCWSWWSWWRAPRRVVGWMWWYVVLMVWFLVVVDDDDDDDDDDGNGRWGWSWRGSG